jgi:hypothetical protein
MWTTVVQSLSIQFKSQRKDDENTGILWHSLNLLKAIRATYTGTKPRVVTPDGTTNEFELLAGVLQGETSASFLFIIV